MFETPPRRHPLQTAQFWFLTLFGLLSVAAWRLDLFDFRSRKPELPVITDEPMPPPPAISEDEFGNWHDFVPAPAQSEQPIVESASPNAAPPAMAPQQAAETLPHATSIFSFQEKTPIAPATPAQPPSHSAQLPRPVNVAAKDPNLKTAAVNPPPSRTAGSQQVEAPRPYNDWASPGEKTEQAGAIQKASWDVNVGQKQTRFERSHSPASPPAWAGESNAQTSPYYPIPQQAPGQAEEPQETTVHAASYQAVEDEQVTNTAPPTPANHDAGAILREVDQLLVAGDDVSAHRLLSSWYWKAPELRPQLDSSLNMLARKIYFQPQPHYLEPHYFQSRDQIETLAAECQVTPEYFIKLNRLNEEPLKPGRQLKRIQGPFSVVVDLSRNELTIHAHGYYVTRFPLPENANESAFAGTFTLTEKRSSQSEFGSADYPILVLNDAQGAPGQLQIVPTEINDGTPSLRLEATMVAALRNLLVPGSEVVIRR